MAQHEPKNKSTPKPEDKGKRAADKAVQEADEESFPASDPPSYTPVSHTGAPRGGKSSGK